MSFGRRTTVLADPKVNGHTPDHPRSKGSKSQTIHNHWLELSFHFAPRKRLLCSAIELPFPDTTTTDDPETSGTRCHSLGQPRKAKKKKLRQKQLTRASLWIKGFVHEPQNAPSCLGPRGLTAPCRKLTDYSNLYGVDIPKSIIC